MNKGNGLYSASCGAGVCACLGFFALCVLELSASTLPSEFKIKGISPDGYGACSVLVDGHPDAYYILYRGTNLTDLSQPMAVSRGGSFDVSLRDGTVNLPSVFYRVARYPVAAPGDLDGDGYDDVFEAGTSGLSPLSSNPGFCITAITKLPSGRAEVTFTTHTNYYYILMSSVSPHMSGATPAAMALGRKNMASATDQAATSSSRFYRVKRVSLDAPLDTDGDSFDDLIEIRNPHLNPVAANPDSDGDGLPDSFEENFGLSVTNTVDGAADFDGDGLTNRQEFDGNTDPFTAEYVNTGRVSVTEAFVGDAIPLAPSVSGEPVETAFAAPMLQQAVSAGVLAGVGSNWLLAATGVLPEETDLLTQPLYVHFDTGETTDVAGIGEGGRLLLVDMDLTGSVAKGARFVVRPHLTVAQALGEVADGEVFFREDVPSVVALSLAPAFAADDQDHVKLADAKDGARTLAVGEAGATASVIYPGIGVGVVRRSTEARTALLHGVVRTQPLVVPLGPGANRVGSVLVPETVSAEQVGLATVPGVQVSADAQLAPAGVLNVALPEDGAGLTWRLPTPAVK